MTRALVILAVVAAAILAVVGLRRPAPPATVGATGPSVEERQRTQDFWRHYRAATRHRIQGRTAEAIVQYQAALDLNPAHEDALYYVGNLYFVTGRLDAAKAAWERLLAENAQSARAAARLGDLHLCSEQPRWFDLDAAEEAFRRALALNKEETGPLLDLGRIAVIRAEYDSALAYLDAVTGSNFRSVDAYYLKGYVHAQRGDRTAASAELAAAIRHARPADTGPVPGEGDTKTGAPLATQTAPCQPLPPATPRLRNRLEADAPALLDTEYRDLQEALARVRRAAASSR